MNSPLKRDESAEPTVWEVERDRFGVMFSGPLEVGECRRVVPVGEHEELSATLRKILDAHDQVSKMKHRDWERAREILGGYRSQLLDPEALK